MHEEDTTSQIGFAALDLAPAVLSAIERIGYEQPTPIQAESIPPLLAGRDLIGMAQTGTGKTAAFALPLLSCVDLSLAKPQILVLAPTRELAIQVSEAFQRYASQMKGFHVVPLYGGQEYSGQLRQLRRGVHAVVGTPGRVMDHLNRGSLVLDGLRTLVLDEADDFLTTSSGSCVTHRTRVRPRCSQPPSRREFARSPRRICGSPPRSASSRKPRP